MKVLSIVETAYRATLEEQDDTVLWFCHSTRSGGAEVDLLLKGSATNYAVRSQDASGLAFGAEKQTQPPRIASDVTRLIASGATVYAVEDDALARGVDRNECVDGIEWIRRDRVAGLIASYGGVWHW